jgi:hypothetical protein
MKVSVFLDQRRTSSVQTLEIVLTKLRWTD